MAAADQIRLGPWPGGMDRLHEPTHTVFQISDERAPLLTAAMNVDIDSAGRAARRDGSALLVAQSNGVGAHGFGSLLVEQEGGTLKLIDLDQRTEQEIVTGLDADARVSFCEHGGKLWWMNGIDAGVIDADGSASHWGMSVPTPVLAQVAGALSAGRYQVAVTAVDANKIESGAGQAGLVTLATDDKAISVNVTGLDDNATHVAIYASRGPDQPQLFWQATVARAALPVTLTSLRTSTRPLRTQHMRGPIPGAGLFSYQGWLLAYRDRILFRTSGLSPHLMRPRLHVREYPDAIIAGAGLETGFWLATAGGMRWTMGANPAEWRDAERETDERRYAAGAAVVSGRLIPALETRALVAVFLSEDGPVAGLPSGQLVLLADEKILLDVEGMRATFAFRKLGEIPQLVTCIAED